MRRRGRPGGRWLLAGNLATVLVTLLVAGTAYGVLTATTETTRLAVRGTVDASAAAAGYDILVRPAGSRSPAEQATGLVQPGFLGAVEGGISRQQWREIEGLPGVEVAAPVAMVGWVIATATVQVDLGDLVRTDHPVVVRTRTRWSWDNGASSLTGSPALLYLTPNPVRFELPPDDGTSTGTRIVEDRPDGTEVRFATPAAQTATATDGPQLIALSTELLQRGSGRRTTTLVDLQYPFPFLLAAVDPAAEARLTGIDTAVVDGSWLTPGVPTERTFALGSDIEQGQVVPVAVADRPDLQLDARTSVGVFDGPAVDRLAERGYDGTVPGAFLGTPDRTLPDLTADAGSAYRSLLDSLATPTEDGDPQSRTVLRVSRTSPLTLAADADGTLTARGSFGSPIGWGYGVPLPGAQGSAVPPGGDDTAFRTMTGYFAAVELAPPTLVRTGVYDASRLASGDSLTGLPLGTVGDARPAGADDASRAALDGRPWSPSTAIWGYPQPPPLMLTTLDALTAFDDPARWAEAAPAGQVLDRTPPVPQRPISAIRVAVAGVTGVGALDRERVRSTAEAIAERTGLDVDITLGASSGPRTVEVAAGRYGRPALTVTEPWVVKGVATRLVTAADRASAALAVLVLLAAALVVLDAVFATVRARSREIGTVVALGWRPRDIAAGVLAPVLLAAVLAGTVSAGLAWLVRHALDLAAPGVGVLVTLPATVGVALLAATGPALIAARTSPARSMRPVGLGGVARLGPRVASVPGLAWRSVVVAPGRAVAAVLGAATATAVLATLRAVQVEFQGRAVGTVLGDAVTVQVRGPDLAAAALTAVLAGIGIHHVLGTEIRERRAELATLAAVGWRTRTLALLLTTQALVVALLGAALGTGAAVLAAGALGVTPAAALRSAAVATAAVLAVTLVSTALPVLRLRRASAAAVLASD
ncbi:FtsX-like permease family protein [Phycicoccus flavus]|uniref:FtsX-like permease family protein n=1 Tax=Phycicoccus flavus TaxID=2502783 RepID=UPI000FEB7AB9|nr:FtsX-like permease family protein [Phycicoccus flavus]NHA67491.1 FtsX-like permease family protein [Phycicoccus flavus]